MSTLTSKNTPEPKRHRLTATTAVWEVMGLGERLHVSLRRMTARGTGLLYLRQRLKGSLLCLETRWMVRRFLQLGMRINGQTMKETGRKDKVWWGNRDEDGKEGMI
jgi:hypothetical protein